MLRRAYQGLTTAEIAAATVWAARRRVPPTDPGNVTLAIKTFERPQVLRRMLTSVRRVYSGPIVIADDSETPFTSTDPLVEVVEMPFDSGVGAGRNALIDAVTTEYLWMADDDMILLPDFDLPRVLRYLAYNPEVDLCGGRVINLPRWDSADYLSSPLFAYPGRPRRPQGMLIGGLPVHHKVPNVYVARTARLAAVRYDRALKRVDHTDFFTTAHGTLLSVCDPRMACLHAKSYFDPHYLAFREDMVADMAHLARKWPTRTSVLHTDPQHLTTAQRTAFHHAAVQVVANDLALELLHAGAPDDDGATVSVARGDVERLVAALRTLGWKRAGRYFRHQLWGRLAITRSPEKSDGTGAVIASFAHVEGLAASPQEWPAPLDRRGPQTSSVAVRWSSRAGWVSTSDGILVASLPLGPVIELSTPGNLIWHSIGPAGAEIEDIVADVVEAFSDLPDSAGDQVRSFIDSLVEKGLLEVMELG